MENPLPLRTHDLDSSTHLILCIIPSSLCCTYVQLLTGTNAGAFGFFDWLPETGTRFTVIRTADGSTVGRYLAKSFFAYHHVNAFERPGEGGRQELVVDMACYAEVGYAKLNIEDLKRSTTLSDMVQNGEVGDAFDAKWSTGVGADLGRGAFMRDVHARGSDWARAAWSPPPIHVWAAVVKTFFLRI